MLKSLPWRARAESQPRLVPRSPPDVGALIDGKYRVVRAIGMGGMSLVFEAENCLTGRNVALKMLHAGDARDGVSAQLLHEARAGARVRHPNVIDVIDVITDGGATFVVLELLRGRTLAEHLAACRPSLLELLEVLLPAMRGVEAAHRAGIVHRDIKPENIFLAEQPELTEPLPKVLDFGIARVDGSLGVATHSGHAVGTPRFMSPEQLRALPDLDARTDVYAFGVILYLTLAGRPPYLSEQIGELAFQMATVPPPHLCELRPELSPTIAEVIMRALETDRRRRTSSLSTLIAELAPFALDPALRARSADIRLDTLAFAREQGAPTLGPTRIIPLAHAQAVHTPEAESRAPSQLRRLVRWSLSIAAVSVTIFFVARELRGRVSWDERPRAAQSQTSGSALPPREVIALPSENIPAPRVDLAPAAPAPKAREPAVVEAAAVPRPRGIRRAARVRGDRPPAAPEASSVAADPAAPTPPVEATAEERSARRTNLRLEHF